MLTCPPTRPAVCQVDAEALGDLRREGYGGQEGGSTETLAERLFQHHSVEHSICPSSDPLKHAWKQRTRMLANIEAPQDKLKAAMPTKILFVCGRNQRRSPTAERIFKHDPRMAVRSVGVSESSKRRITENDLVWADLVLVMERKYAARIKSQFPADSIPTMRSLDIPDDFEYMDSELIELIRTAVEHELSQKAE